MTGGLYDCDAVRAHVERLFARAPGVLTLSAQTPDGTFRGNAGTFADVDMLVRRVDELEAGGARGVYLRQSTTRVAPPPGSRGTAADTYAVPALWADVDYGDVGHRRGPDLAPLPPDEAAAHQLVAASGMPTPSFVVHSGGGLYPYWQLDDPFVVESDQDRARIGRLLVDWQHRLHAGAERHGWDYGTGVGDLPRVLRIAGTVNRKAGLERPCRLIRDDAIVYGVAELEAAAAALAPARRPTPAPARLPATGRPAATLSPFDALDEHATFDDLLLPLGFTHSPGRLEPGTVACYRRPGDPEHPVSAKVLTVEPHVLVVWSDSTGLPAGAGQKLTKGRVFAGLHHGRDERAAAADIRLAANGDPAATAAARALPHAVLAALAPPAPYPSNGAPMTATRERTRPQQPRTSDTDPMRRDPALPVVHSAAWHGLSGQIVRAVAPTTEADPVGVLVSLLAATGACIGDGPHIIVGDRPQPVRIWALVVGATGTGRKGTAWAVAERVLDAADAAFVRHRIASGLTSGEGLIAHLRDPEPDEDGNVAAIVDKRLLVVEPEFARVLGNARREGNVLSSVLRQAWETGTWQVITRHDPLRATGAHLAIVAHITPRELRTKLADDDIAGGLANRFLPVLVGRSKLLPHEPEPAGIDDLAFRLRRAMATARRVRRVRRTPGADTYWTALYGALEQTGEDEGRVAEITARGPAYVQRIALLYALLDEQTAVDVEHLRAAAALWRYVLDSAQRLYGQTGDPDLERLAAALDAAGERGLSRGQVHELYQRHRTAAEIDDLAGRLVDAGRAERSTQATKGRPADVLIYADGPATRDPLTALLDAS